MFGIQEVRMHCIDAMLLSMYINVYTMLKLWNNLPSKCTQNKQSMYLSFWDFQPQEISLFPL